MGRLKNRMASRPHSGPRGRDLTQGPIGKALLAFAVPTLISSILQSLKAAGSLRAELEII